MALGKNVRSLRLARGWELEDLSKRSGVKVGTISAIELRDSVRSQFAPQLADAFGIPLERLLSDDALATGEGDMLPSAATAAALQPADHGQGVRVPLLANAASMGLGSTLFDEDVIEGELTLTPTFVADRLRPARPEALRFIHAYGDSMEPTFSSGDILLVDAGARDASIDGIYVLEAHGRLFVKRVRQRMDGSFEISSDNPAHKTVDTLNGDHQVAVKGRVIWAWNGRKL